MEQIFKNQVIIITGASYGIGKATALAFASRGANVVLTDYKENKETLISITNMGGNAIFIKCDVSVEEEVKNMVAETITQFGRLDFAFNNAGIEGTPAAVAECSNENWDRTLNTNLKGVWLCMKYQIPELLKSGGGVIVNNASIAGLVGFAGVPAYVASKHGVVGLTKNAALDYAARNIRINAVCPGIIQTPMIDRFTGGDTKVIEQMVGDKPMGRIGRPEEIAETVVFLCSSGASYITGQAIAIDGGWTSL